MKIVIDIPEILLDRIKSAKCVPDMYGSDIANTVVCVRNSTPYKDRPQWIPCSERLPEKHGRYIVTNAYGCVREYDYNDWAVRDGKWLYCRHEILAWMPLPEPYEGEQ